jgi:hypothetical protein
VICIPRVVFPWQKKSCGSCQSCDGNGCNKCINNGARTRKVCVLKPSSYKCPKCEYTWTAEKKEGCAGCAAGTCSGVGCDGGACDAPAAATSVYGGVLPSATQTPLPSDYGQPAELPVPVINRLPTPYAR